MADALALKIGPELQAIRRHAPEVLRGVFGSRCVDPNCTVLLGDRGELIRDDELLRFCLRLLKYLQQLGELCRVSSDALAVLGIVGRVGDFDLGESDFFSRVVRGADLGRAFEGHVLEHVRDAARTLRIVGRARIDQRVEAENGGLGTFAHDQSQPIRQDLHRCTFLEACKILRLRHPN